MTQPGFLRDEEVRIDAAGASVAGRLTIPRHPRGIVAFAHGSGSSRHSPRNTYVAEILQSAGLGTLLFDLLTEAEEADRANVFDIALLSTRLREATEWLRSARDAAGLPVGYFGASTGAGAALQTAADPRSEVFAVVSRGGRPDLAGAALTAVRAPTLLIVGGRDPQVLELNRAAAAAMHAPCDIAIVEGATHLFEEPGALEQVASLARAWFLDHLTPIPVQP